MQHIPAVVTQLGFASQTPAGIEPCWLVGVTLPGGQTTTLHLTVDSARIVGESLPPVGDRAPFIQRSWSLTLPPGAIVTSATVEVMIGQTPPPTNDRVTFDRFTVNGLSITSP